MPPNSIILKYDVRKYPFHFILASQVFRIKKLNTLHKVWQRQTGKDTLTYEDNLTLRKLMQSIKDDSLFYKLYHAWIARIVAPHFGGKITYSAHPKMRVHLAGTGSVSAFHRDAEITDRAEQINCYLPFTDVANGATLLCESTYGAQDYHPINLRYGEALLWDGGMLKHGTLANDTEQTRVSCDFRFIAKKPEIVASPYRDILSGRPAQASH